jgi:cell division protein ZapA (FtsZ GTPase activity inhibitor)
MSVHKDNIVELQVLGRKLVVKSGEDDEYIRQVEEYLNEKIGEVRETTKAVSSLDLALLTALNLTGECIKAKEELENMEKRSEELIQKIDRSKF